MRTTVLIAALFVCASAHTVAAQSVKAVMSTGGL
jgi:hypothetical protein